ncbi:MAG: manganese efflux pump MntP [Candidatus Kapaibacteriales bacterium]
MANFFLILGGMETFNFTIILLLISVALGLDSFSVVVGIGSYNGVINRGQIFRLPFYFGLFQLLMTIIGWAIGIQAVKLIADYRHWVAFLILALLGIKMIIDSNKPIKIQNQNDCTRGSKLIFISIATSIDALAIGFSISLLSKHIFLMALVIGITAGLMTIFGIFLGKRLSQKFERKSELLAGLVLICIGLHILLKHLDVI